jgi:hypothetical protein
VSDFGVSLPEQTETNPETFATGYQLADSTSGVGGVADSSSSTFSDGDTSEQYVISTAGDGAELSWSSAWIDGVRIYATDHAASGTLSIRDGSGTELTTVSFSDLTIGGWTEVTLSTGLQTVQVVCASGDEIRFGDIEGHTVTVPPHYHNI